AAAAAGEDQDVDLRRLADRAERLHHRLYCTRPLHVRLGHQHPSGREAGLDGRQDVAFGSRVVAGDQSDPAREAWQRALAALLEDPLGAELLLQPLERGEVLAEAEPLDRERAQSQLALLLPQLRPAVDVDALSVRKVEAERIELSAG